MMGRKTNLSTFKGIKILQGIFSDHYEIELEINYIWLMFNQSNYSKIFGETLNIWKLNSKLLNNP